jgi:hypothetical protein
MLTTVSLSIKSLKRMNSKQADLPRSDQDHKQSSLVNHPDAARLITGLRDTGYDFYTASADIIDNSIAANASHIKIDVLLLDDGRKYVYFGDDGDGMNARQLWEAMRYGAPKRPSAKSLGKFGLGLKTASSACCKKFAVISRPDTSTELAKLAWDLDHVENINKWEMLQEPVTPEEIEKFEELCGPKGTMVVWSKCDKILGKVYEQPGGIQEHNALNTRKKNLKEHLAKVFHKYLDTKISAYPNVTIELDGYEIEPWNPFYPERSEQVLAQRETIMEIESEDGTTALATINAWILPHSKDLTDNENKKHAKISNRSQGFYIYREGRMIFSEGWLGIFRSDDPHFSLLRAEFCFDHDLDHAFQVDVKKSRIIFDPALEEELKKRLTGARNEAERRYRRKEKAITSGTTLDHGSANKSIEKAKLRTKKPTITEADPVLGAATLNNNRGTVKIRTPVQNNVSPDRLYIEEVTDITDGNLWEPSLRSVAENNHVTGVRLNKHHDFYSKVYLKSAASGYAIEGIDILLWALATAEFNNNNADLKAIFEDFREEVSSNLKKLLSDVPMPDPKELNEASHPVEK